ncbi:hypothetical protein LTR36_010013 [Oleoguttula mirabilis]|uniref:Uncharacterized protein n=1 Tax=Oleoguttula mirabilis TaxID=1507867 RepID=A0AAV9JU88_9PEZI|nr:hypothetical protein LTR36_010013 [Oleoguttula mirabilis]
MAGVTPGEREDHSKVMGGLGVQMDRLDRHESELFGQIMAIKQQKRQVEKQKEDEIASFEQKRRQTQVQVTQAMQTTSPSQRTSTQANVVVDLTDSPPLQPVVGVKRERSPSPASGEMNAGAHHFQQRQRAAPGQQRSQPGVNMEKKKRTGGTKGRVNHRSGHHAVIADTHPTVITMPNTDGAIELRCDICGGNAHPRGEEWTKGLSGFVGHFQMCHRGELAPNEYYSQDSIIERCTVYRLSQEEVEAVQAGDPQAYVVKMIPGAGRDAAAARGQRGLGTKAAAFDPNRYGRSAEEEVPAQAKKAGGMKVDRR